MKKSMLFLLALLLLSGCVEEGNALDNSSVDAKVENSNPSYLEVELAYEESELFPICESYVEQIMSTEHERYAGIKPYNHQQSANVIRSYETKDSYVYEMECSVHAHYQLNMFNQFTERYKKNLGEMKIEK